MFNKVVLTASAVVFFSGAAMAADAIVYNEPAPFVAANTFSWEGAYVGANAGYGFGKMKAHDASGDTSSFKPRGFAGGVQAGYNWQFDQVVAGIEADFQGSTMKKSFREIDAGDIVHVKGKVEWFGTVRGRLGADIAERTMLYGTVGLAYGKVKVEATETDGFQTVSSRVSKTRAGWTAGAGIEHAFTDNVSLKTEYLYTDLGKVTLPAASAGNLYSDEARVSTKFHTVRVGVNYKF